MTVMLKLILNVLISVSLFSSTAIASSRQDLKAVFDDLNYALTVEWDQKDRDFYDGQVRAFYQSVADLQEHGLSTQDMIEFVKSEIKDERLAGEFESASSQLLEKKLTPEEASRHMMEAMKNSYASGASWISKGDVLFIGIVVVVSGGFFSLLAFQTVKCMKGGYKC